MLEVNVKPLVKGALSFALPALRSTHRPVANSTGSGEYCYSVFLRHFSRLSRFSGGTMPRVVAEFGPGDTIGTGLAALLAGAERYYALDIQNHTDAERNLQVFDILVALFKARSPVPRYPDPLFIFTQPREWGFPPELEAGMEAALAEERLEAIRQDLISNTGRHIRFAAPWHDRDLVAPGSIGWIFSHSVMEHVDEVAEVYRRCAEWLADGGYMTHEIDYGCHNLTKHWNGHWRLQEPVWKLVRGRRPYLINRLPHQEQRAAMLDSGFEILEEERSRRDDGVGKGEFAQPFARMSDDDARTNVAFVLARLMHRMPV